MATKKEQAAPAETGIVDNLDALMAKIKEVRAAQQLFATYTQEQVDEIFRAAAMAANKQRIPLAKMAVEETGMGVAEDKVIKNHYASEYIYNAYKHTKTCGVIEEDAAFGIKKVAEPIGVVAAVIPTTTPTSTAIFKTLISLKTRNGIIISPHPRAKKCTIAAAKVVLDAAVAAGAPKGIIGWIDVPSLEMTNELMRDADIILATGGPGMVKAAYSSGKPALGVGAGNTPAIIDDTADVVMAVNSIIHSKTFDNGMICASEQSVILLDKIYNKAKKEFVDRGCYILKPDETEKVRKTILINGSLNAKIVGQSAHTIATLAGVDVPERTKILIGEVESVELEEEFAHEKLSPVLAMYRAKDFDDAVAKAERLIADGGYGHTSSLYVDTGVGQEKIAKFGETMKTCRILINTQSSQGGTPSAAHRDTAVADRRRRRSSRAARKSGSAGKAAADELPAGSPAVAPMPAPAAETAPGPAFRPATPVSAPDAPASTSSKSAAMRASRASRRAAASSSSESSMHLIATSRLRCVSKACTTVP